MRTIDGQTFKMMLLSGANHLYNHYPEIDALNVFPVPDGDTGMNMNLTLQSGSKEISNRNENDIYSIAKNFSRGLLMGARGNSGVITSQIFRGISDGLKDKISINASELADALISGKNVAYKRVTTPVEGTILTVIRESSEALKDRVRSDTSIEEAFTILLKEAKASLERTPNLLPVLKEVGVVDSGGAGLVTIFEGMLSALKGEFIYKNEATAVDKKGSSELFDEEENIGYLVEFIMKLGPSDSKKTFQLNRFKGVLNSHSTSLKLIDDNDVIKVHLHTYTPGNIISYAQSFGEFSKIKIQNLLDSNKSEPLFNLEEENNNNKDSSKNEEIKITKKDENVAPTLDKEFAIVATSSGKGIDEYFNEIGVDALVSGGQTMNPSTNDFVDKIEKLHAKNVFILPNNSNIIMAANQAIDVLKNKVNVVVIPTKTIMQGLVVAMSFNPEVDLDTNVETMNEAINSVKSGCVTFAIKDTDINGVHVTKDEFMAIRGTKDILGSYKNKFDALKSLVENLVDEDSSILTILVGQDINEKEEAKIKDYFDETYNQIDCDIRRGDQPVYSYLVGVE